MRNKYTGKKVPNKEVITIYFHLCKGIFAICLKPTSIKNNPANRIRKLPICMEFTPFNPYCIRMKELPHTHPKKANKYHFVLLFSIPLNLPFKNPTLFSTKLFIFY